MNIPHGPFASPYMKSLLEKYGRDAFARSSACMEFESFLKQIKAGGKCALEIGTHYGISAFILSQYFERVVCVSIDVPEAKKKKFEFAKFLGIKNIDFHDVADNQEKAAIIKRTDFDFAFSDGDHANDTMTDFELVKRCGRVLLHEVWAIQKPVWDLALSLPQNEMTYASVDCFAYWNRHG